MKQLEEILIAAHQKRCLSVTLQEGSRAQGQLQDSSIELQRWGVLQAPWLQAVVGALQVNRLGESNDKLALLLERSFSSLGTVYFIVYRQPTLRISAFLPPTGESLCKKHWALLGSWPQATAEAKPAAAEDLFTSLFSEFSAPLSLEAPPLPPSAKPEPVREAAFHPEAPPVKKRSVDALPRASSAGKNLMDDYLLAMMEKQASDVHLSVGQPIIFRVEGEIARSDGTIVDEERFYALINPLLSEKQRSSFAEKLDIDFAYEISDKARFRVNLFNTHRGKAAVFRHIPSLIPTMAQLQLPPAVAQLCKLSKGLVLVTGPTGSGKSTTLAAMINEINESRREHIITIEDPIEFVHPAKNCLVNQREVGKHTMSFASALRAALREDPDIVLVGELRDLETTAMAIETAETGHVVFATLHTNSAVSTIDRIIDQFPATQQALIRSMLAANLRGVISQTLCRKEGGGRIGVYEVLIPNDAVAAMIREGKNHMIQNHMQTQKAEGNALLNEALVSLIKAGKINYWEGWRKAIDKKDFELLARRAMLSIPRQS
jgi:twitching motility protein PilT